MSERGTHSSMKAGVCIGCLQFFQAREMAALLGSPAHLS